MSEIPAWHHVILIKSHKFYQISGTLGDVVLLYFWHVVNSMCACSIQLRINVKAHNTKSTTPGACQGIPPYYRKYQKYIVKKIDNQNFHSGSIEKQKSVYFFIIDHTTNKYFIVTKEHNAKTNQSLGAVHKQGEGCWCQKIYPPSNCFHLPSCGHEKCMSTPQKLASRTTWEIAWFLDAPP